MNGTTAARMLDYFHRAIPVDNASTAQYPDITVRATMGQGGVSEAGGHVFVAKTPEAFVHDDDGNLLSDGRWAYTWDGENRLVSMTTHASVPPLAQRRLVFAYDHMSRRATKHEFTRNPATGTLDAPAGESAYAWDGWTLAAEFAPSTGAAVRRYVWNPSGRGGHRSLAAVRLGGGTGASASPPAQFAVVDANANVSLLLNGASGTASAGGGAPEMSAVYEYGPFGEPLRATGPLAKANPVRFSSELLDTATGCYYYGYRYYNPDTGRWLSRDPIGELGGVNLYGFVGNNPINRVDHLGLKWYESFFRVKSHPSYLLEDFVYMDPDYPESVKAILLDLWRNAPKQSAVLQASWNTNDFTCNQHGEGNLNLDTKKYEGSCHDLVATLGGMLDRNIQSIAGGSFNDVQYVKVGQIHRWRLLGPDDRCNKDHWAIVIEWPSRIRANVECGPPYRLKEGPETIKLDFFRVDKTQAYLQNFDVADPYGGQKTSVRDWTDFMSLPGGGWEIRP